MNDWQDYCIKVLFCTFNFLILLSNYHGKMLDMRVDSFDDILELHNDGGHG